MIANLVTVKIKPEFIDLFLEVTLNNHKNSRLEAGNIRFDVLRSNDDPFHFTLYEVFADKQAIEYHKTTEHYKKWAEAMEKCMEEPRTKISNTPVAFD